MSFKIDQLRIENFRGVRDLTLPLDGRNLIVVGENGSGKSSIVDALEYFFAGRVEPLEGRGDVDVKNSIPYLDGGPTAITLQFKGGVAADGVTIGFPRLIDGLPPAARAHLGAAERSTFVLRRSQLMNFIEARDAQRYEQISQLIGLGALDRIDDVWRKQANGTQKRVEVLQAEIEEVFSRLSGLLCRPVRTRADLVHAVNAELAREGLAPIQDRDGLAARLEQLRDIRPDRDAIIREQRWQGVCDEIAQVEQGLADVRERSHSLRVGLERFWQQSAVLEEAEWEQLLREGQRLLQDAQESYFCPLCEAPIGDVPALMQRLGQRLARLQDLAQARQELAAQAKELADIVGGLRMRLASVREGTAALGLALDERALDELSRMLAGWEQRCRALLPAKGDLPGWDETSAPAVLAHEIALIKEVLLAEQAHATPSGGENTLFEVVPMLTRVDEGWQRLEDKRQALHSARYVAQQVGRVYQELVEARKRGLERLRRELEADLNRLYTTLHPDEGYEGISIPVQKGRRSSVALRATYQAQEETHPLSYFSEGHLDSLGLCIFLAFIKRFSAGLKLMVLDDVLTTVDAGHRLRVARMLAREFADYQLVITTHDRLWARELERVLPNTRLLSLKRWSLAQGADCWHAPPSDWEYYAQQAVEGRPQDAIAGGGRNLEKFLYQMRNNLRLAVAARPDGDYTIGDLYPPFLRWLKQHPVQRTDRPDFAKDLEQLQAELEDVWRLRNWSGAHFNVWAESVSANEALSFLLAIERLVRAFECPHCGSLVAYNRAAKALICPNCDPSPPERVVWQYKPGWHAQALRLMEAHKQKVRNQVVPMAQSTLRCFLNDARHRLGYSLAAEPFDHYALAHLYEPFFDWAAAHPRPEATDWGATVARHKTFLDGYWTGDAWGPVSEDGTEAFVDAVHALIGLFECATCKQLLNYDPQQGGYYCVGCSDQESSPGPPGAYWFVA